MKYLVDTDWVAYYLKGRESAVELLTRLAGDGLGISLVTFGEIYEGIYYGKDPEQAEQGFREFLDWVDTVPLNRTVMKRFARIRGHLRGEGQLIGDPDTLIAATAIYYGLTLGSRNVRHFERVPGLQLYPVSESAS